MKLKICFLLASFFVISLMIPASVNAAKGSNVILPVKVVDTSVDPAKVIKNSFVAMYKVKLIDMGDYSQYEAKQFSILATGSKGLSAKFVVKPNEVVYFLGFKTKKAALSVKKFIPQTPPIKNFSAQDGIKGQVCHTAGTDFNNKLDGGADYNPCAKKWEVELYDFPVVSAAPVKAVSDVLFPVTVVDASADPVKIIPNTFVAMYSVSSVDNFYQAVQKEVKPTGMSGLDAKFLVKPEEVVYFLGFTSATAAAAHKTDVPQTPPLKNFYAQDGVIDQVCHTAGTDFSKKFNPDDQNWCAKKWEVEVTE